MGERDFGLIGMYFGNGIHPVRLLHWRRGRPRLVCSLRLFSHFLKYIEKIRYIVLRFLATKKKLL
ncbi:hypothetical protein BVG89_06335 [Serratia marcescens]|nr:hypothetical protein BVG92_06335 [Serratia marcescens]ASM25869.1 hypothetical protein BVG89_06335 [Serratia marcescens]ASM30634.1 hypothetical protein BVG84_06290 [Serratia marcescens]